MRWRVPNSEIVAGTSFFWMFLMASIVNPGEKWGINFALVSIVAIYAVLVARWVRSEICLREGSLLIKSAFKQKEVSVEKIRLAYWAEQAFTIVFVFDDGSSIESAARPRFFLGDRGVDKMLETLRGEGTAFQER